MPIHLQTLQPLDANGNPLTTLYFQDLTGEPLLSSERVEILSRRGVDGVGLRAVGSIPEPFQLLGTAYQESFAKAKDASQTLRNLIGHQYGTRLTLNSVNWGTFDVLSALSDPPQAVFAVVGAIIPNPQVFQRYAITMIERTAS